MFGLFISLILLGLSAIDPVGIAAMPILLVQKKPYARSFTFLAGSFISLMVMGLVFARGFGALLLNFENSNTWFVPSIEAIAGVLLMGVGLFLLWRLKTSKTSVAPSDTVVKRLRLGSWQLFITGALLVAVQSIVDVVFVVAMIHIGQLHMNFLMVTVSVATYAIAALVLQLAVVLAYSLAPEEKRIKTLGKVHSLLDNYASQALIVVSLLIGCILIFLAI